MTDELRVVFPRASPSSTARGIVAGDAGFPGGGRRPRPSLARAVTALGILGVLALVLANAFFVVAEYALVTAPRAAVKELADGGSRGARAALTLMDDPVRFIGTVQVGITAVGIALGALGEPVFRELFDPLVAAWISFTLAFAIVTYITVVVGELVPKALALHRAAPIAAFVAPPDRAAPADRDARRLGAPGLGAPDPAAARRPAGARRGDRPHRRRAARHRRRGRGLRPHRGGRGGDALPRLRLRRAGGRRRDGPLVGGRDARRRR